jgi:hypothetical protein
MDFAMRFLVTTSVNKKWLSRLIEALTEVVFSAARLQKEFPNGSQKIFFVLVNIAPP